MSIKLTETSETYSCLKDIAMSSILSSNAESALSKEDVMFEYFVDDDQNEAENFESFYRFLHEKYFPQIAFGLVYVSGAKTKAFVRTLELIGFMRSSDGLWPSIKYCNRILN